MYAAAPRVDSPRFLVVHSEVRDITLAAYCSPVGAEQKGWVVTVTSKHSLVESKTRHNDFDDGDFQVILSQIMYQNLKIGGIKRL